jgi:hypothetical protein
MAKNSAYQRGAEWFKKLDQPASGMYQVSRAGRVNSAPPFDAAQVVEMFRQVKREHMADHRHAVSNLRATLEPRRKQP